MSGSISSAVPIEVRKRMQVWQLLCHGGKGIAGTKAPALVGKPGGRSGTCWLLSGAERGRGSHSQWEQ